MNINQNLYIVSVLYHVLYSSYRLIKIDEIASVLKMGGQSRTYDLSHSSAWAQSIRSRAKKSDIITLCIVHRCSTSYVLPVLCWTPFPIRWFHLLHPPRLTHCHESLRQIFPFGANHVRGVRILEPQIHGE